MTAAAVSSFEGVFWRPSASLRVATERDPDRRLAATMLAAVCAFTLMLAAAPIASSLDTGLSESRVAAQTDTPATVVGDSGAWSYDGVLGCCVAPSTAPPRFVAASDGIIDTASPALRQQIDDVADAVITTGTPPPGVRQGGVPGKPGVWGNRAGDLPEQPLGYYTETDVWPGPGPRGTERLVVGDAGEVWYTPDHYGTFRQVG